MSGLAQQTTNPKTRHLTNGCRSLSWSKLLPSASEQKKPTTSFALCKFSPMSKLIEPSVQHSRYPSIRQLPNKFGGRWFVEYRAEKLAELRREPFAVRQCLNVRLRVTGAPPEVCTSRRHSRNRARMSTASKQARMRQLQ